MFSLQYIELGKVQEESMYRKPFFMNIRLVLLDNDSIVFHLMELKPLVIDCIPILPLKFHILKYVVFEFH